MEPVYDTVIAVARSLWAAEGLKFTVTGAENVPRRGGAVVALNHTGYLDFTYAGLPAFLHGRRKVRFMAKKEVFDSKVSGPIMRSLKHIPVDRAAGAESYHTAVDYLRRGELVGVYPEATISRSFEIKSFKSGAARMALEAGVPIVPTVIWGAQRVWTKGHPKRLGRTNTPIHIGVAEPLQPTGDAAQLTEQLHKVMSETLLELQDAYGPHPAGEYWVPARLGGGAPTLEEANRLDAEEAEAKATRRAAREE
ncbi:lysophospholipid acyltransferase family protein [Williamsia sterculiae]|uniref:1-acyl-sn-glycerol-3-phosphate acyltransferase n=1 Tax=Williamsia sterculiae TaxID=1344003 RepID=A0A1N7H8P6_9NOCA|nr:lysophospholipid acyltransferase family protein [Williamsia sterculiae]SIS21237.1 1-acyl-sn-glycerol-3-phosphate acyltransferase [Williamsia sterculiae]